MDETASTAGRVVANAATSSGSTAQIDNETETRLEIAGMARG